MRSNKSFWITVITCYTVAWGWSFLFANAYFWDEWFSFYGRTPQEHAQHWGGYPKKHFLNPVVNPFLLTQFSGVWIFRLLIFVLNLGAGIAIYKIISRLNIFTRKQCQLFTLVFLLAPINHARFSIQTFEYSYSMFFFCLGWYLILMRKPIWRLCSLGAFLIAIGTPSFCFFILLPMINLLFEDRPRSVRNCLIWFTRQIDVFILVISFIIFFRSSDSGPGQFSFRTSGFVYSAIFGCLIFGYSLLLLEQRKLSKPIRLQATICSAIALIWLGTVPYWIIGYNPINALPDIFQLDIGARIKSGEFTVLSISALKLAVGALATFLVLQQICRRSKIGGLVVSNIFVMIYILNTYFVGPMEWESRTQLLWPFGLALLSLAMFEKIPSQYQAKNMIGLVVVLTLTTSLISSEYYVDSLKQKAIISEIRTELENRSEKIVEVSDDSRSLNARQRTYRIYEWSGIIDSALKDNASDITTVELIKADLVCAITDGCISIQIDVNSSFYQALLNRKVDLEISCINNTDFQIPATSSSCRAGSK